MNSPFDFLNDTLLGALHPGKKQAKEKLSSPATVPSAQPQIYPTSVTSSMDINVTSPADVVTPVVVPEAKKRVTLPVYLPGDLKQRFQAACAADGQKMSALIKLWITEYLKKREQYEN